MWAQNAFQEGQLQVKDKRIKMGLERREGL